MKDKLKFKIKIKDMLDARTIVKLAGKFECNIDLLCEHYVIDLKSVLGLYSIDYRKETVVQFHGKMSEMMRFQQLLENENIQVNACL